GITETQLKLLLDHSQRCVRAKLRRLVRFIPIVPQSAENQPIGAGHVRSESRVGAVSRPRIHLQKVCRREQLWEQVIEEGVVVVRAAKIVWSNKQPLALGGGTVEPIDHVGHISGKAW